jgi:hypothetical protein
MSLLGTPDDAVAAAENGEECKPQNDSLVGRPLGPGRTAVSTHVAVPTFEYVDNLTSVVAPGAQQLKTNLGATVRADLTVIDLASQPVSAMDGGCATMSPEVEGFFQRCGAFLFVYDPKDRRSFEIADHNMHAIKEAIGHNAAVLAVAALPYTSADGEEVAESTHDGRRQTPLVRSASATGKKPVSGGEGAHLAAQHRATFFAALFPTPNAAGAGADHASDADSAELSNSSSAHGGADGGYVGASVLATLLAGVICLFDSGFNVMCTRTAAAKAGDAADCCMCFGLCAVCAACIF